MKNISGSKKIYAFGSLILGILLLLWPGSALRAVSYVAGVIVMAGGITSILAHFRSRNIGGGSAINLIVGIIVTLAGGWIFLHPEDFAAIIPTAIGYLIVLSGITNLLQTFTLSRAHYRRWWLSLLAAVLTIFMGMFLVNHAIGIAATMVRLAGAFLLFNGISDLWIGRRVDQYVFYGKRRNGSTRENQAGGGMRRDTSDPDIIDAEDYREL